MEELTSLERLRDRDLDDYHTGLNAKRFASNNIRASH